MRPPFLIRRLRTAGLDSAYSVYIPPGAPPAGGWAAILFLHGVGERGTDGVRPTTVGIGPAILADPSRYPAVVVFPQCRIGEYWARSILRRATAALDEVEAEFAIDPTRVYLTGTSMGGYGTFALGSQAPDRFAALVPVCGGGEPDVMAPRLKEMPVWIFHGADDDIVPVEHSRRMAEALAGVGVRDLHYTEYPGVGHMCWDQAYAEPEMIAWLFKQRRRP